MGLVVGIATLPWTVEVAERLDWLTAVVGALGVGAFFALTAGRRGIGWASLRGFVVFGVVAFLTAGVWFTVCVATGCIR